MHFTLAHWVAEATYKSFYRGPRLLFGSRADSGIRHALSGWAAGAGAAAGGAGSCWEFGAASSWAVPVLRGCLVPDPQPPHEPPNRDPWGRQCCSQPLTSHPGSSLQKRWAQRMNKALLGFRWEWLVQSQIPLGWRSLSDPSTVQRPEKQVVWPLQETSFEHCGVPCHKAWWAVLFSHLCVV